MKASKTNRALSLLLSLTMCAMLVPAPAFATDGDTTATNGTSTETTTQTEKTGTGSDGTSTGGLETTGAGSEETEEKTSSSVAKAGEISYDTLQAAVDAADAGTTVELLSDSTEDVVVAKNITLDLGNNTLTNTGAGKATVSIASDATVSVKNGSIIGGASYYTIENKGSAIFADITATAGNTGSSMIDNWGTLTIESGVYSGGLNVVKSEQDSTLVINGGEFTLSTAVSQSYTAVVLVYGDTTITGGVFTQSATTPNLAYPEVVMTGVVEGSKTPVTRVTGGTFVNKHSKGNIFWGYGKATSDNFEVSGGQYSKKVTEGYCAEGYIPASTKNSDGYYSVKQGSYVASVGSSKYETLNAAIAGAAKGKTVKLLANIAEDVTVKSNKKDFTLDLNGYTLTNVSDHTITNNGGGTLTITDSSEAKTGTIDNLTNGKAPIENNKGATCVIEKAIITRSKEAGASKEDSGGNSYYYIENFGTMTIGASGADASSVTVGSDGHFSSLVHNGYYSGEKQNPSGGDAIMTINAGNFKGGINTIKNDDYGRMTINGGTFLNATQYALQNWNVATINGGSFESTESSAVFTGAGSETMCKGITNIYGGEFKSVADSDLALDSKTTPTVTVYGGAFNADPSVHVAAGYSAEKGSDGKYVVAATTKDDDKKADGGSNSGSTTAAGVEVDNSSEMAEKAVATAAAVKDVEVTSASETATIGGTKVSLTSDQAADLVAVKNAAGVSGAAVDVNLVVKADANVDTDSKIAEEAPAAATVIPFDLSVDMVTTVKSNGSTVASATVPVVQTASLLKVTIAVDKASIADSRVSVARNHDGKVTILDAEVDYDNGKVTFETDQFSSYAVMVISNTQSLADYTNADGSRKSVSAADFALDSDYVFAGWYKDKDLNEAYSPNETSGIAYPAFVKVSELITFKGGSLRMDGNVPGEYTNLRFGYETRVPDGATRGDWYWTYSAESADIEPTRVDVKYYVLNEDGSAKANLVLTEVPVKNYTTQISVAETICYQTADGTNVTATAEDNVRSVSQVAKMIKSHGMASSTEKEYANKIINALD